MSLPFKEFHQFDKIEDFAVENDTRRPGAVLHGLLAAAEIDDAEPGMDQAHFAVLEETLLIGPAMPQRLHHRPEPIDLYRRTIQVNYSGDSTHRLIHPSFSFVSISSMFKLFSVRKKATS